MCQVWSPPSTSPQTWEPECGGLFRGGVLGSEDSWAEAQDRYTLMSWGYGCTSGLCEPRKCMSGMGMGTGTGTVGGGCGLQQSCDS